MLQHTLIYPQFAAGTQKVDLAEKVFTNLKKIIIIQMFDIAFTVDLEPSFQPFVGKEIA